MSTAIGTATHPPCTAERHRLSFLRETLGLAGAQIPCSQLFTDHQSAKWAVLLCRCLSLSTVLCLEAHLLHNYCSVVSLAMCIHFTYVYGIHGNGHSHLCCKRACNWLQLTQTPPLPLLCPTDDAFVYGNLFFTGSQSSASNLSLVVLESRVVSGPIRAEVYCVCCASC